MENGVYPSNAIAYELWMDTIEYLSAEDVHVMKYKDEIKHFWSLGYKLFKGNFVRFMSGFKSQRKINFAVPDVKILREHVKKHSWNCSYPGIIKSNIKLFQGEAERKSFKLSIDGKKIASGFGKDLGDVDLFGHEPSPTLQERKTRHEKEKNDVHATSSIADEYEDNKRVESLDIEKRQQLLLRIKGIIEIFARRTKELRQLELKKTQLLDNLIKNCGTNWQQHKLNFAISGIKTSIYRLRENIKEVLSVVDRLGHLASCCCLTAHNYCTESILELDKQHNFTCLLGMDKQYLEENRIEPHLYSRFLKQRGEAWFDLRKEAKVTGSSLNKSIGLDTLKAQRTHYDVYVKGMQAPPWSDEQLAALEYGRDNEIHAMGTLVSKVI